LPFPPSPVSSIPLEREPDLVAVRIDFALSPGHHVDRIAQPKLSAGADTSLMQVDRAPTFTGFIHHVINNGIRWHESIVL
jgi:hypothetical protein